MIRPLIAALAAALSVGAHAQTTLTYSSWVSPQHHLSVWQANWTAEVEKATGGRVKFQALPKHPSAPPGTFDAVRDGLMDLSYVTASYTPVRHTMPLMAELPGAGDTAVVNSVAYSRIHWKHFHKLGEYKGVKLLGVWTHGPGQMFTKKPVANINDIKGLKIRTGGGVAEAVANAIGASAFVKPAPESYELLKSGVADGVFFPLESVVSFKLDTVLEQAIEKLSYEYVARSNGRSWDAADQKGLDGLKKAGVKIVLADQALLAEVQKRSAPIIDDWIKKASAKGVDAKAILAEFRAELKKVAAAEKK
jgi:TRAP-type C4-dicarboxylate transport system substrate-binding protein